MYKTLLLICLGLLVGCNNPAPSPGMSELEQATGPLDPQHVTAETKGPCRESFAEGARPELINPKLARDTQFLCYSAFAVLHSGVTRTPLYSAEHLTRAGVSRAEGLGGRDNRFHAEDRLPPSARAELDDYRGSGYDRGHLAPSGDMPTRDADHESFSLANIVPQAPELNRSSWAALERDVRDLASRFGDGFVVTGPLYEGKNVKALNGRVLVPTATWKAIYIPGQGAGAWIATNTADPQWQVVSIDELSRRTGIDPFPMISPAAKTAVPDLPIPGQ